VLEEALGAPVKTVKDALVRPLEIEGVVERLADAYIAQLGSSRVEEVSLRAGRAAVGHVEPLHSPVSYCGNIVGGGPIPCSEFLPQVERSGLEAFEAGGAVTVVLVAQLVEIVAPAVDRQVLAPIVVAPPVADERALLELADLVRPRAQRRRERRLVELA